MPSQRRNNSDIFRFCRAAFYNLKGKVGLAATKGATLGIKLKVGSCGAVGV